MLTLNYILSLQNEYYGDLKKIVQRNQEHIFFSSIILKDKNL